jgi:hypothetical protein
MSRIICGLCKNPPEIKTFEGLFYHVVIYHPDKFLVTYE